MNYLKDRENDLISRREVLGLINGMSLKYGGENSYSALMMLSVLESDVVNLPAIYDLAGVVAKLEDSYRQKVEPGAGGFNDICSNCMVDLENELTMQHVSVVLEGLEKTKNSRSRRA